MAASGGHLELCSFLLRESSFFNEDALMLSALERSLQCQFFHSQDQSLMESFYNLLLREHNMDLDLRDSLRQRVVRYSIVHTMTSFKIVLASQPTSFLDLSFKQRFNTTLASFGWPADAFLALLHDHDPAELARMTTENGKTALHWAVTHFGTLLRDAGSISHASSRWRSAQSFASLASRLISMGADVHALWHAVDEIMCLCPLQCDPFLCFLGGAFIGSYYPWDETGLARAVDLWGRMLVDGGLNLSGYVKDENKYLRSFQSAELSVSARNERGWSFVPRKLLVSEESTLLLEVIDFPYVDTWKEEATLTPGAWPISPTLPDTIMWYPEEGDNRDGMRWVWAGSVYMAPTSHERKLANTNQESQGTNDLLDKARRRELGSIQDDHGLVSLLLGQREELYQKARGTPNRRRASSCPPFLDTFEVSSGRRTYITRRMYIQTPSGCGFTIHKCPLDSRWRRCWRNTQWRSCMRGQCQEDIMPFPWGEYHEGFRRSPPSWYEDDSFEGWFLRNEAYSHVARRYAEKFCPERMHIVDRVQERATQRALLAMGPKRKGNMIV
jgi:hypothetical protein